jgi:multicomponent Na+:H+ antiporter subunit B|tara:strand:+ start:83 stop:778 length:696 start_codon:yes stop_codon:yes gene_type:complete
MKSKKFSADFFKSSFYFLAISFVIVAGSLTVPTNSIIDANTTVKYLVATADIPNSVTAVILGSRLFDTIGEVIVFTIAGLGVKILLYSEDSETRLVGVQDPVIVNLLDFVSLLSAFLAFDLAIRGHLTPGGGFAAGVAGATSITLLMISGRLQRIENFYSQYNAAIVEKFAVIVFIILALMSFTSSVYPTSPFSWIPQNIYIPVLNVVAGLKVTIGAWSIIRLFIVKRGII